jgi:hypothetical protein
LPLLFPGRTTLGHFAPPEVMDMLNALLPGLSRPAGPPTRALRRIGLTAVLVAAALAGPHVRATPLAATRCDFNNDGFDDLAIGVPGENVGSAANAGAVNVIYGSNAGLTASGDQIWHQDSPGVAGVAGTGDTFGATVVCGNFNVDQYDDLAIGVPGEDVGALVDAGAVNVLYGSNAGLTSAGNDIWHQNVDGIEGVAESGDRFGAALAAGDFDDDFADDLAVGVPGEDVGTLRDAGSVNVLYGGGGGGLLVTGNQLWNQDSLSVRDTSDDDESFGAALAAGDFDNDGFDDLAIGVPGEDLTIGAGPTAGNAADAGAINVLHGSFGGLAADRDQFWSQVTLEGAHESGDHFGHSLASGDFDDDGFDDLAVGVPGEDVGSESSAGAVNVLYGSGDLLTLAGSQIWHQDSVSVVGGAEEGDAFGAALAADDFDGDGTDDLAVGVPGEDVDDEPNAGAFNVLFGAAAGLTATGSQIWHQDSASIEGVAEPGNVFGSALAGGNFDGDNFADLVAGVPGEGVDGFTSAGAANVLYGTAAGPSGAGDQIWHQGSPGIEGVLEHYDRMSSQPMTSNGVYRIPYLDGTNVLVTGDHFSHSPDFNELDLNGKPDDDGQQYTIVAAAAGTIVRMDDSNAEPTSSNNYVWVAHANGEWTKYTHFETGSVTARGLGVGSVVSAGTILGFEGDVGQAQGEHLHFEVVVPDDPDNPIDGGGFIIGQAYVPLICGVAGNVLYDGELYIAGPC